MGLHRVVRFVETMVRVSVLFGCRRFRGSSIEVEGGWVLILNITDVHQSAVFEFMV